jgi:hypothetical protein
VVAGQGGGSGDELVAASRAAETYRMPSRSAVNCASGCDLESLMA